MVKQKNRQSLSLVALLLMLLVMAIFFNRQPNVSTMKTSEVIDLFRTQQVTAYELNIGNGNLSLTVKGKEEKITYKVPDVYSFVEKIDPYVDEYNDSQGRPRQYQNGGWISYVITTGGPDVLYAPPSTPDKKPTR